MSGNKNSSRPLIQLSLLAVAIACIVGCNVPINRNQEFDTALAKITVIGNMYAPMGSQSVGAILVPNSGFTATLTNSAGQQYQVSPAGDPSPVNASTAAAPSAPWVDSYPNPDPSNFIQNNMYMPAQWTVSFSPNQPCYDPNTPPTATPPYPQMANPQTSVQTLLPGVGVVSPWYSPENIGGGTAPAPPPTPIQFTCFINTPANPLISPVGVLPRFALDDALPSSVEEAATLQITAAASYTSLHVYAPDFSVASSSVATSVSPDGMSATFPYPTGPNGSALPSGTYLSTITTDVPGQQETTNSLEPIMIGHDDQTYAGAFGVAYANPQMTVKQQTYTYSRGTCLPRGTTTTTSGLSGPIVTSITQNLLYLPDHSTISVGSNPTVVIALPTTNSINVTGDPGDCDMVTTTYSGPQSALVVNTGSNTVQVVGIGQQSVPTGTITVGQQPVAAVVGPGKLVYVANYGSGTISEVDPVNLIQTRTLQVMSNPTSVNFDASGNLWVGGKGFVDEVSVSNWSVTSSTPIDGTINQMGYSPQQNALLQVVLQNGTTSSPSNGQTMANAVSFSSTNSSYSTITVMNAATGASSGPTIAAQSNAAYVQSPLASVLAFPAQTAFVPVSMSGVGLSWPGASSSSGDMVAVANGDTFTVSALPSGDPLMSGTLPYPIRGVAVGGNSIYFTMPESNSVVTVAMKF